MGNQEGISRPNNKPVDSMSQDCRCGGKKAGANGWMFLTAALLIVLVIVILRLMPRPNIKEEIVPISQADKMVVTGVIRTTGLGVEDKSKLGLTFSDYQITDFGQNSLVGGYYLESGNKEIKELLGACIRIIGKTVPGWEGVKRAEEVNYLMFHRCP